MSVPLGVRSGNKRDLMRSDDILRAQKCSDCRLVQTRERLGLTALLRRVKSALTRRLQAHFGFGRQLCALLQLRVQFADSRLAFRFRRCPFSCFCFRSFDIVERPAFERPARVLWRERQLLWPSRTSSSATASRSAQLRQTRVLRRAGAQLLVIRTLRCRRGAAEQLLLDQCEQRVFRRRRVRHLSAGRRREHSALCSPRRGLVAVADEDASIGLCSSRS